jgi:hypothetical protein
VESRERKKGIDDVRVRGRKDKEMQAKESGFARARMRSVVQLLARCGIEEAGRLMRRFRVDAFLAFCWQWLQRA